MLGATPARNSAGIAHADHQFFLTAAMATADMALLAVLLAVTDPRMPTGLVIALGASLPLCGIAVIEIQKRFPIKPLGWRRLNYVEACGAVALLMAAEHVLAGFLLSLAMIVLGNRPRFLRG